jgi:hypothetical protein
MANIQLWQSYSKYICQICEICYARLQGVDKLLGHFKKSGVMNEKVLLSHNAKDKKVKPLFMSSNLDSIQSLIQQQVT